MTLLFSYMAKKSQKYAILVFYLKKHKNTNFQFTPNKIFSKNFLGWIQLYSKRLAYESGLRYSKKCKGGKLCAP